MSDQFKAYGVHLFTATGAALAMLAMLAAVQGDWPVMFLWLLAAFAVDGIDGPLARKYDVTLHAPIIDGTLLDLIIDFLTYVFIPAFALYGSGLLPNPWAALCALGICFSSVLYFSDTRMKLTDKSFRGFPGCWNLAVLVFMAMHPAPWIIVVSSVVLAAAMFLPLKFVHPTRTKRWRNITLPVATIWVILAVVAAWQSFEQLPWLTWSLGLTTLYLTFAGILQQVIPQR
ncbi:phosphatidylcholine synthase [Oceanicola sp. D3]|uniref:CDP-alcohol phosphatidyltransferase family protein n=1 Tax=Oceanicola sp. D3 TaxID=2587163 RepID=UPI00112046AE|nr:phosphatidylcholine synthase [Oceanicola sp. D3]QDC09082.1 phosphatidylcholine synthase [Oceanicola sp. D3]